MFTGAAVVDVVAVAFPLNTDDACDFVPPTICVYVASDDNVDDIPVTAVLDAPVFSEAILVKLAVAAVLPSKSKGTVAAGTSPLDILALLPVIVMISTEVLSNCAVARLASHRRRNSGPIIVSNILR